MLTFPELNTPKIKRHGFTAYREVLNGRDSVGEAYHALADEFGRPTIQPWQPKRQNSKLRLDILNKTESAAVVVRSQRMHGYRDTSDFASYVDDHVPEDHKRPMDAPLGSFSIEPAGGDQAPYYVVYWKIPDEYYEAIGRPLVTGLLDEVGGIDEELRKSLPWTAVDLTMPCAKFSDPELAAEVLAFKPEESLTTNLSGIIINYSHQSRQYLEKFTY